jgi:uncharacterized protein (TIGR02246 family)
MTTTHTAHDVAVRLFARLEEAWNASDGAAFGSVFADQTDFVDVRGGHYCVDGVAVGARHQAVLDTVYARTAITYRIETARAIASDVIVAVASASLVAPPGPLPSTDHSHITAVIGHDGERWCITAFQNTLVRPMP